MYASGVIVSYCVSDITDVRYVINYDFPQCCEDYVHRVGRTARGNDVGTSYTFITNKDSKSVKGLIEILEESSQKVPDDLKALSYTGGRFQARGGLCRVEKGIFIGLCLIRVTVLKIIVL